MVMASTMSVSEATKSSFAFSRMDVALARAASFSSIFFFRTEDSVLSFPVEAERRSMSPSKTEICSVSSATDLVFSIVLLSQ